MGVVRANKVHFVPMHALRAHPNIGLDVFHDMADMKRAIRVGQCSGDEELFFHIDANFRQGRIVAKRRRETVMMKGLTVKMTRLTAPQEFAFHGLTEVDHPNCPADLIDPNTGKTYAAGKAIKKIEVNGDDVNVHVVLPYPAKSVFDEVRAAFAKQLAKVPGLVKRRRCRKQDHQPRGANQR